MSDYAERYARMLDLIEAAVDGMTCDCYFPDFMEYGPQPCSKCQLEKILHREDSPDAA